MGEAVSQAVTKLSDSSSTDGTAAPAPPPSRSPAGASARGPSGSGGPASPARSTDRPTTPAGGEEDPDVLDNALWGNLEKRRAVLENRGQKAVDRYRADLETKLGVPLDQPNTIANIAEYMRDPIGYFMRNRQHFERIARERGLIAEPPAPAPAAPRSAGSSEWAKPLARLQAADGSAAYDAEATDQLFGHLVQRIEQLQTQLGPIQQSHGQMEEERLTANAYRWAEDRLKELSTWDGFEDLKDDMGRLMATRGMTDEQAYNYLIRTKYLPSHREKLRGEILNELRTRPAVPPRGPAPDTGSRSAQTGRARLTAHEAVEQARARLGV